MNTKRSIPWKIILLGTLMVILAGNTAAFGGRGGIGFQGSGLHEGFHGPSFHGSGFRGHEQMRGHDEGGFGRHDRFRGGFFFGPDWFWGPTVIIEGVPYYYEAGQYYVPSGDNLVAVPAPEASSNTQQAPVAPVQKSPEQVRPKIVAQPSDTVINVPNSDGGITSVILTKKDKGYVGPSGEYYTFLPTPAQLKDLYGK